MSDKPVLYFAPMTRAETCLWMDEELGGVCDVKSYHLHTGGHKVDEVLAVNPLGKLPAMTVGDQVVTEAAAICAFLADRHADKGLAPQLDDPLRGPYFRWIMMSGAGLEPAMLDKFAGIVRENPASTGHGSFDDVLGLVETAIVADGPYLLGDKFTTADVVMGSTVRFAAMFGAIEEKEPFTAYLNRIKARPAFQRAQARSEKIAQSFN